MTVRYDHDEFRHSRYGARTCYIRELLPFWVNGSYNDGNIVAGIGRSLRTNSWIVAKVSEDLLDQAANRKLKSMMKIPTQ